MKATDRILKQGSFYVFHKGSPHPVWQIKQVIVTQDSIYFFEANQSLLGPEIGKINLASIEAQQAEKSNKKFEIVFRTLPSNNLSLVKLYDREKKTVKFMACNTKKDSDDFCLAISLGSLYSIYQNICNYYKLPEHESILQWVIQSMQTIKSYFIWIEDFFTEDHFLSAYQLIKNGKYIHYLAFDNTVFDNDRSSLILQIIGNFPAYQLQGLRFKENSMDDYIFDKLSNSIAHHVYIQHLEISNNCLTDESLKLISIIIQSQPYLQNLILSHNRFEGRIYFEEFIESILTYLNLKALDLSYNEFCDDIINIIIAYIFKQDELILKELDLSYNRFSKQGYYALFNSYYCCKNKDVIFVRLKPIPFHAVYLRYLLTNHDYMNFQIERVSSRGPLQKRPASKISECQNIDSIIEKILAIRTRNTTIEEIAKICETIYNLEYEFPPQKLDYLYYILKEKIEKAIKVKDYYSLTLLLTSAEQIGLETNEYDAQVCQIRNKIDELTTYITKIINFELSENEINKSIDDNLNEIITLGLRGHLIDTLFWIKERRDETIKKLHRDNYQDEDIDDILIGPFAFLDRFMEYASKKHQFSKPTTIPDCLLVHPLNANYLDMCKLSIESIQKYLKEAIEYLKQEENYYMRNAHNRCYFILTENSTSKTFKLAKSDKKLHYSRLIIQYINYLQPKIEKKPRPLKLSRPVLTISFPDNLEDFNNTYKMNKFQYLKGLSDFNSKLFNHIILYEKDLEKVKYPYSFEKSVTDIFQFFKAPLYQSIMSFTNKEAEEYAPIISNILFELLNLDIEEDEFLNQLHGFLKILTSKDENIYEELFDECYLQIYRYTNTPLNQSNLKYYINMYTTLIILTYFIFPSADLLPFVKAWMYHQDTFLELKPYCDKILLNLLNAENPEFIKPDWIPSEREIFNLMKNNGNLLVEVKFFNDEHSEEYMLPHFADVNMLMQKIYDSPSVKNFADKYTLWIYKISKNEQFQNDQVLFRESRIAELWSIWDKQDEYNFIIKRRVYCCLYTLNYTKLDNILFETLYETIHYEYFKKIIYSDYIKMENVVKAACLLYLTIKQTKKSEIKIRKEKLIKYLKDIIPQYMIDKKTDTEWSSRMVKALSNNLKWYDCSIRELQEEFLKIFNNSCLYASSLFEVKKKDNVSVNNIPLESICSINIFGIFFLLPTNKDKPVYAIEYDQLVYAIGFGNDFKLSYIDKQLNSELKISFICERARELAEDIISCAQIRTLESNKLLYAYHILRDFKVVYFGRRLLNSKGNISAELEMEITEDDHLVIEAELEKISLHTINKPELVFHNDLPFYGDNQKRKATIRKLLRKLPALQTKTSLSSDDISLSSIREIEEEEEKDKDKEKKDKNKRSRFAFIQNLITEPVKFIVGKKDPKTKEKNSKDSAGSRTRLDSKKLAERPSIFEGTSLSKDDTLKTIPSLSAYDNTDSPNNSMLNKSMQREKKDSMGLSSTKTKSRGSKEHDQNFFENSNDKIEMLVEGGSLSQRETIHWQSRGQENNTLNDSKNPDTEREKTPSNMNFVLSEISPIHSNPETIHAQMSSNVSRDISERNIKVENISDNKEVKLWNPNGNKIIESNKVTNLNNKQQQEYASSNNETNNNTLLTTSLTSKNEKTNEGFYSEKIGLPQKQPNLENSSIHTNTTMKITNEKSNSLPKHVKTGSSSSIAQSKIQSNNPEFELPSNIQIQSEEMERIIPFPKLEEKQDLSKSIPNTNPNKEAQKHNTNSIQTESNPIRTEMTSSSGLVLKTKENQHTTPPPPMESKDKIEKFESNSKAVIKQDNSNQAQHDKPSNLENNNLQSIKTDFKPENPKNAVDSKQKLKVSLGNALKSAPKFNISKPKKQFTNEEEEFYLN